MTEQDPLDMLRGAWQGLEPGSATPDLEDCDADTRRAVEFLRSAWNELEAPATEVPNLRRREHRPTAWRAAAVAAMVLAVVLPWMTADRGEERGSAAGEDLAVHAVEKTSSPTDETPALEETSGGTTRAPSMTARRPRPASQEQGLEMRSGNVRLVLLFAKEGEPYERTE